MRFATPAGWILLAWFSIRSGLLRDISTDVRAFQAAYVVGFAGYLLLVWVVLRQRCESPTARSPLKCSVRPPWRTWGAGRAQAPTSATGGGRYDRERRADTARSPGRWRWWLLGALALRLPLAFMQPSDDLYRYVWEGRIQHEGFNPYVLPPDDPKLAHLRDDDWVRINHPDYSAAYPPLAQLEFRAITAVCPSIHAVKAVHIAWDFLVMVLLGDCLRRIGRRPHVAVLYGLCPLVLTSFAIEGHLDSLMLLLMVLCVRAVLMRNNVLAGTALGLSIAAKFMPILLLPWFLGRRRPAAFVAVAVAGVSCLPYIGAGRQLISSVFRFGTQSEFFSLLGAIGLTNWGGGSVAWFVRAALVGAIAVAAFRRRELTTFAADGFALLLIAMPVVHFWYASWVMCLLPFRPRFAWIAASLAFVTYFEAAGRQAMTSVWEMPAWAPRTVWGALLLGWLVDTLVSWRGRNLSADRPGAN